MVKRLSCLSVAVVATIYSFIPAPSFANEWVARHNGSSSGDYGQAICVDNESNVYVASGPWGWGILKYNPAGDTAWTRKQGFDYYDCPHTIAVDDSGNVYVAGMCDNDYLTVKYKSNGDTVWTRTYNGPGSVSDEIYAMAVDGNENVYVTGRSFNASYNGDYLTIKYKSNGDTAWVRRYNGSGNGDDWPHAIAVDNIGNSYVTGEIKVTGGKYDYATIKYSSTGDTLWVKTYNGPRNDNDEAYSIAVDDSGYVYVTGKSCNTGGVGSNEDYATIKYNPDGDTAWVRRYNGASNFTDCAVAVALDANRDVYVGGWSVGASGNQDCATIKYTPAGDTTWVRTYNGPANNAEWVSAMAVDSNGNAYITGWNYGSGGGFDCDYLTIKYTSSGTQEWIKKYNGTADSADMAYAITVDNKGYVYVTGGSMGQGTGYDCTTIKYSTAGVEEGLKPAANTKIEIRGNPFGSSTIIKYYLSAKSYVSLKIYDISGNAVKEIVNRSQEQGSYAFKWDGRDSKGKLLSTGIYFAELVSGTYTDTKKIVLMR